MAPFLVDQKQSELFPIPYSKAEFLIMRSGINLFTTKAFSIPYPVSAKYFSYYKLLYWTGQHLLESIEAGIICRDGIAFRVQFHGITRGQILSDPDAQYAISFRAPTSEWEIDPVVLISTSSKPTKRN